MPVSTSWTSKPPPSASSDYIWYSTSLTCRPLARWHQTEPVTARLSARQLRFQHTVVVMHCRSPNLHVCGTNYSGSVPSCSSPMYHMILYVCINVFIYMWILNFQICIWGYFSLLLSCPIMNASSTIVHACMLTKTMQEFHTNTWAKSTLSACCQGVYRHFWLWGINITVEVSFKKYIVMIETFNNWFCPTLLN